MDRQAEEDGVEVKKNEEAGQDLYKNSQECPSLPADQSDSPPPCLQPGWGSLLPPAQHQTKANVQWRPWMGERETEVDKDLNQNSQECPPPSAFDPIPTILITPKQHGSSGSSINTKTVLPPPNMIRRAKKRRRSPGDLAKRRKRKFDFLSSQRTPYYTPYTEPEKSRLELERRDCGPWARRLDWSTTELPEEKQDRSNLRGSEARTGHMGMPPGSRGRSGRFLSTASKNLHGLSPPPPQSLQMPSPSPPCPPANPPWQASNWAPPSPTFCHGCNQWCDLVEVSIRRV